LVIVSHVPRTSYNCMSFCKALVGHGPIVEGLTSAPPLLRFPLWPPGSLAEPRQKGQKGASKRNTRTLQNACPYRNPTTLTTLQAPQAIARRSTRSLGQSTREQPTRTSRCERHPPPPSVKSHGHTTRCLSIPTNIYLASGRLYTTDCRQRGRGRGL
jgi:hypothetical protein